MHLQRDGPCFPGVLARSECKYTSRNPFTRKQKRTCKPSDATQITQNGAPRSHGLGSPNCAGWGLSVGQVTKLAALSASHVCAWPQVNGTARCKRVPSIVLEQRNAVHHCLPFLQQLQGHNWRLLAPPSRNSLTLGRFPASAGTFIEPRGAKQDCAYRLPNA